MAYDQSSSDYESVANEVDRLLGLILSSGLVQFSELRAACADFDTDRTDSTAVDDLSEHLIANGTLSEWQCSKIRQGRWKGFYLDEYCLVDHLGVTETTTTYLARNVETGKRVAITITPPDLKHYRVSDAPE
jgi:eukaryotic-like serine/threonine-protein kinase